MPTDPNKINVARVIHVSDDENSDGEDEILTAAAIQRMQVAVNGVLPTLHTLMDVDLAGGVFTYNHASGNRVLHVVVFDNTGKEVLVSPFFDPLGVYLTIDFSPMLVTGSVDNWVVSVWTVPEDFSGDTYPPYLDDGNVNFYRSYITSNDTPAEVDLTTLATHIILTAPADRAYVIDDFSVITRFADGVSVTPTLTLYIEDGLSVLNRQVMPLVGANQRYFYDIKQDVPVIVPAGKKVFVQIADAGVAAGVYTAVMNISGYFMLDYPTFAQSSSSSSSS